MTLLRHSGTALRWCASGLATLGFWTLWLCLALLLCLQGYIATTNQLEVPRFVLRDLESRLEVSGVRATFGRTRFDPSGRILIENVRITLPGFAEPVIAARALYVKVDPWDLLIDRFEPSEIRVTGASLRVPAMLSPSASAEEGIRDLDATLEPRGDELDIECLTARAGPLSVAARGTVHLGSLKPRGGEALPIADFLAQNYTALCREISAAVERLGALDHPVMEADLAASETECAVARVTLTARSLSLPSVGGLAATDLRIFGQFPLLPRGPVPLDLSVEAAELRFARPSAEARGLQARILGRLLPRAAVTRVEIASGSLEAAGLSVGSPIATADLESLPRIRARVGGELFGAPVAAQVDADLRAETASARFTASVDPAAVDWIGARLGRNLGPYFSLEAPVRFSGTADFSSGWKFGRVDADLVGGPVLAHRVRIDEAVGRVIFDGRTLSAPEAAVRVGENTARGSYEGDVRTGRFRFLLEGGLRPLDITPWFPRWWPDFFGNFQFPAAPPTADIDLHGRWGTDRETSAFLWVDSARPVIRGGAFDRLTLRIFTRPDFEDGLEFKASLGKGSASGTFARWIDPGAGTLRRLDVDVDSTLPYPLAARVYGPPGADILSPFAFDRAPDIRVRARLDGAAAPGGPSEDLRIDARTDGGFRFHDFPFEGAAFTAAVRGQDLSVDSVSAGFAGGRATGSARVTGTAADRRISLECRLEGANLAKAVAVVQAYSARGQAARAQAPAPLLKEQTDATLDLAAKAQGRYGDPLGLTGTGIARIRGTDLLQVKLLGLLSQVINFTSLRFTAARADFALNGPTLTFSDVDVTGANSAIEGRGTYDLNRHVLDFNAKVFPFRESKFFLPQFMNVVTAPLSHALEVKLTGSLYRPSWSFVAGPTNILRSLLSNGAGASQPPPGTSPLAPAP